MTQHTPGPWTVHTNFATATYTVFDADGNYGETDADTLIANAALIAAAPELLTALRAILDDASSTHPKFTLDYKVQQCVGIARAAISRATGGAQ